MSTFTRRKSVLSVAFALSLLWPLAAVHAAADTQPSGTAAAAAPVVFIANNGAIAAYNTSGTVAYTFAQGYSANVNAMAMDASGVVYAAHDTSIDRFSQAGTYLGSFTTSHLTRATGLAFDSSGNLYAADSNSNTVQRFAADGSFAGTFASGLHSPIGIAFTAQGDLLVANDTASSIQRFSSTGTNLGLFATAGLAFPTGLAIDTSGNVYVGNYAGQCCYSSVRKFSASGAFIRDFGGPFGGLSMNVTYGVAVDDQGRVYVTDTQFNRMLVFAADGSLLPGYGSLGAPKAVLLPMPSAVPEPASALLFSLGIGLGALVLRRRTKQTPTPTASTAVARRV